MAHPLEGLEFPFVPIPDATEEQAICNVLAYGQFITAWLRCDPSDAGCPGDAYEQYLIDRGECVAST